MDALKAKRTQFRRLFSKAFNEYEKAESTLSEEEKLSKLKLLEEKAKHMIESEELVREELLSSEESEEVISKEFDESENYIDKWRVLEPKLSALSFVQNDCNSVSNSVNVTKNSLLLYPKLKLPLFDGNIKNWLGFWGQFKKIDCDQSIDDHDKFAYLQQSMEKGSSAEELIRSFPPGGESYTKAVEQLKARYGKEDLLIEVYVRDLLSLVLEKNSNKKFSLRKLHDSLESKLRALEILGVARNKYAAMLYPLVESSLPNETLRAWQRFRVLNRKRRELGSQEDINNESDKDSSYRLDLDELLLFLLDEIEGEERVSIANKSFGTNQTIKSYSARGTNFKSRGKSPPAPSASSLISTTKESQSCIFCTGFHKSSECYKARKMSLEERQNIVQSSQSCFLCLDRSHKISKCRKKASCIVCGKKHHELLCRNIHTDTKYQSSSPTEREDNSQIPNKDESLANLSKTPNVLLQTLMVTLSKHGFKRRVRAIIDSASQRSYILNSTAAEMNFEKSGKEKLCHSLFGGTSTGVTDHDIFTVFMSKSDGSYRCNFKGLGQETICSTVPPIVSGECIDELNKYGISINDQNFGPIEILIGADIAGKLMTGGFRPLASGLVAIETKLGWTVMGKSNVSEISNNSTMLVTSMLNKEVQISDLWSLDSLGILDPSEKRNQLELQEVAREHFLNTICVENDRFVVKLPWLEDHPPLPDYYELALRRLHTTVKRLKSESLYEAYQEVLNEWLREGIIEEVDKNEERIQSLYLPHRAVVKEDSTTKIRPVFDASAKTKGNPSLNDCLEKGPNLIEHIPSVLTRFRKEKIGVIADIRKAFLQIGLSPADRNYLRFLWTDREEQLKEYRHCRVVFGVSSSPFLLNSTIQYHLQAVLDKINIGETPYPKDVILKLMNSFYVDNCVTSVKSESELDIFIKVSSEVMAERKFDLRGWEHTDPDAQDSIETKFLGLIWNRKYDTLHINTVALKELCFEKVTKRTILSAAHRLFDPLGVTCPVILTPKLLLQEIWKTKMTWDEEVDLNTKNKFFRWMRDIVYLEEIHFPRYFGSGSTNENSSIHFFCDASKHAYAVVVFLRVETANSVTVQLLQARSRVAPTGKEEVTISRLELLAATISSRLSSTILPEISYDNVYYWTDSSTVLAWITREEPWGIFVFNRVKEIRELTDKRSWNHVPGSMNPADLPSRGCTAQYLLKSKWWEGPSWLYLSPEEWRNNNNFDVNEEEILKERKKNVISSVTKCLLSTNSPVEEKDWYYRYFAKYSKIVNLIAWIMRFIENCRSPKLERKHGIVDSGEILKAEKKVIKMIQKECFKDENDVKLKNFQVFKDQDGIIRLKTKLVYRHDSEDFKTPAVLPSQHKVVERLIFYYHVKNCHVGTQMLLNIIREKFWILNGRKTIRSIVSKCVMCKRYSAKKLDAVTAPLPFDRVREATVFEICGIDLAGPLILRGNQKAWICLFTCAVYRAVHLELVTAISTEAFLLALRRFIARRGRCEIIYCDNGTNFIGASNSLQALDWDRIISDSAIHPIEWKFNPPTASWWGGWWERLIGIMKNLLRKVLGQASLTYEEMTTVLCDCEAIINSRPITYVAENDAELTPLSPSMFLQDIKVSGVPDCDAVDSKSLNKRVKYRQELQNSLRKRFRSEYLGALLQRPESKKSLKIVVGDIVLIGSDNTKRLNWPLGKVIEIIPSKQGVTRLIKLQTANGHVLRPIQRLYPLEVSAADPLFASKAHVDRTVGEQSMDTELSDCETEKSPPKQQKTRLGRIIKIPKRLDL